MINRMKQFFLDAWQNNRKLFIATVVLLISCVLLLSRCGSDDATSLPGGGAGIFLIAALLTVGAVARGNKSLFIFSMIFWAIWLYPKVMPILNLWGVIPSFAFLLFLGMVWWISRKGNGRFGYRLVFATILLFSAVGMSGIVNKGIEEIKKVNIPKIPIPSVSPNGAINKIIGATEKMADALATRADAKVGREAVSARKAQQIQKTWTLKTGTLVYENPGNGIFVPKADPKYDKDVEVISLEDAVTINGATYEKCGLPDPITGQPGASVGWIFSGDLKNKEVVPEEKSAAQNKDVQEPIQTVKVDGSEFPQQIVPLLEGEFEINFQPPEAADEAKVLVLSPDGEKTEIRDISNNCISIGKEEKGYAIGTKVPAIAQIYAQ